MSTPEDGSQDLKIKSSWLLSCIYQRRLFISAIQQPRGKCKLHFMDVETEAQVECPCIQAQRVGQ